MSRGSRHVVFLLLLIEKLIPRRFYSVVLKVCDELDKAGPLHDYYKRRLGQHIDTTILPALRDKDDENLLKTREGYSTRGMLLEIFDKDKNEFKLVNRGLIENPHVKNNVIKVFDLYEKSNYDILVPAKEYKLEDSHSLLKITGFLTDFNSKKFRFKIESNTM